MQRAVRQFMITMGQHAPSVLNLKKVNLELRAQLILEEALETVAAMGFDADVFIDSSYGKGPPKISVRLVKCRPVDWPEVVDGICDLLYVTLGVPVEAGFAIEPFFKEVHRTNMLKVGGKIREDGKRLKPEGWEPPRIKELWDAVRRVATARKRTI